jgi:ABC-type taurine transport system ATPase subunit
MVFQDASLYPWRTVSRNVELGLELRGVPAAERRTTAGEYLDLVGLASFENASTEVTLRITSWNWRDQLKLLTEEVIPAVRS